MEINIELTPKQFRAMEILEDKQTTELLFGGGAGGGKSWLGCIWIISSCLRYPGSRWLIGRAVLTDLKKSTLLSFFEICKVCNFKKDVHYKYKSQEGIIKWFNKSEIYLKDLFAYPSDPEFDSLGSTEYTGAFLDEASQVINKAKNILTSRLRYKLEEFDLIPKTLIATNPSKNFAYYEFYKPHKDKKLPPYRKFIQSLAKDNPYISPHYIENLKKLDKNSRERLQYGNWEYDDDPARLFDYEKILDIFTNEAVRGTKYCIVDPAGRGRDDCIIGLFDGLFLYKIIEMDNISAQELDNILRAELIPRSNCLADEDGVGFGLVKDLPGIKGFVNNATPIRTPDEKEKKQQNYKNLKTQCWFTLSHYVQTGRIGCYSDIPVESKKKLIEDLEQIKEKNRDKDQPLQIIGKEKIKEKLGRSTDRGDILMMRMMFELKPIKIMGGFLPR